ADRRRRGHDPHRHGKPHATPKRSSVNFQKGSEAFETIENLVILFVVHFLNCLNCFATRRQKGKQETKNESKSD
ncbi:hypothetical protein, partial [Acetobacter aceti]|uniref:hypothetical protein n=1 Tax=Acetobacter aceti TaxID=435 RepID=UPI001A9DABFE